MQKNQITEALKTLPNSFGGSLADLQSSGMPSFDEDLEGRKLLKKAIRHLEVQSSCGDPWATLCLAHPHIWYESDIEQQDFFKPMGFCFQNAGRQAVDDSSLVYVEGFAIRRAGLPLPQAHAWVVTREGKILDSTWQKGVFYFGVPIATQALARCVGETGFWGVLNYRMPKWMMKEPHSWIARI
jgi:hypothetical protein